MPGYATWKQLYCEEFRSMTDEGYDTEAALSPSDGEAPLPFPDYVNSEQVTEESERRWREAYERLWALRGNGIRADYRYDEPMGYENIISAAAGCPVYGKLSEEEYHDRIIGAVCGRAAGVILGKPVEMGFDRKKIREYLESVGEYPLNDWIPAYSPVLDLRLREDCLPSTKGNVAYVQPDDDIHYTILALLLAERKGMGFTLNDVGENWLDNVPYHWFWCASRQAYYRMVNFEDSIPRETQIAEVPAVPDDYSQLFWMDYRDSHVEVPHREYDGFYPYLWWAEQHFFGNDVKVGGRLSYPLTNETRASEADYEGIRCLYPEYADEKNASPHTWHAAEMFLYFTDKQ